jgi:predicted Zn-dependent peptidase
MSIRVTSLPSGLRVATDAMDSLETTSIGLWVGIGTRHESVELNGVSHMLEHMAFKGTKRRNARAIAEEIESVGGHINAYTSRENTAYYAKVLKEDVGLALDILADILQHSVFDPEELARERTVVLQEIGQAEDTPDDVIFDRLQAVAFPNQPLGRPVLGSAASVQALSRTAIAGYMQENYAAPAMVLSAAGRIDHDWLVERARELLASLPSRPRVASAVANYAGGDYREERDLEQVHLALSFSGLSYLDPQYYAAAVLSTLFGGGMSSRLFQEVREKRGLAYSIYSFAGSFVDGGMFGIYAGTGEKEAAELVQVTCEEIGKVSRDVREEEVARARAQLKSGLLMSLESSSARAEALAQQLLIFDRPISPAEIVTRIDSVDCRAVLEIAERIFSSDPSLAALGPIGVVPTASEIRALLS